MTPPVTENVFNLALLCNPCLSFPHIYIKALLLILQNRIKKCSFKLNYFFCLHVGS